MGGEEQTEMEKPKQAVTQGAWDSFVAAIDAFVPEVGHVTGTMGSGITALAYVASNSEPAASFTIPDVTTVAVPSKPVKTDSIEAEQKKLDTAVRLCEKVIEHGLDLPIIPDRLKAAIEKLTKTQEDAEAMQAACRFATKYKKDITPKQPLNHDNIVALEQEVTAMAHELQANAVIAKHEMKEKK